MVKEFVQDTNCSLSFFLLYPLSVADFIFALCSLVLTILVWIYVLISELIVYLFIFLYKDSASVAGTVELCMNREEFRGGYGLL